MSFRPTWADIDLSAIRHNVRALAAIAKPAELLAVVKADAYGHGAVPVARTALECGATWLGVALVEEAVELRDAGIDARMLVLSEPPLAAADEVVARRLTPVVYTRDGIDALAKAVADAGADPLPVHLKVDTGMHRVGCSPAQAAELIDAIASRDELELEGICTHFAAADESEQDAYTDGQIAAFEAVLAGLPTRPAIVHACNSAGAIGHEPARYDLVRTGLAMYGIPPMPTTDVTLEPALSIRSQVSYVKELAAGETVSYGRHYAAPRQTRIATVPIGYADGVPRNLGLSGGEVLIGGRRHPIAGSVTMDQLMVDVGAVSEDLGEVPGEVPGGQVETGDEVVLLGTQGDAQITAQEWADRLGIITYEVVTRLGPRLPRRYP